MRSCYTLPLSSLLRAYGRVYAALAQLLLPDLRSCFDPAYYLHRYPDVQRSGLDPLAHFLRFGARENRQPNPHFDPRYYLASYPDVAAARANPLTHFLRYGWKEGRRPNPLFDAAYYTSQHPDPLTRSANPFVDYVLLKRHGESPRAAAPFRLPSVTYQVATTQHQQSCITDIIIPVYSGLAETRICLTSLLAASYRTPHQIILVNDHSPDPELTNYLRDMAAANGFVLLENSANLGFAASVNRGMQLHPDRDVVLLNNDTEVAGDWLDRLAAAAYSTPRTGTATPFSNHATICSYPQTGTPTPELDSIFRQVNAGHRISIPTAVGFCMYIRRDCLHDTGPPESPFRADVFGKGYGEENDFCLRAIYKGWDHVLAADVFVHHAGETSFGAEAAERRQSAAATIDRLYPEYNRQIADFERRDPAKPYRIAVSAWRMRHSGKAVILSISHGLGGGTEQYVRELRESLAGQASLLELTPSSCELVTLRNLDPADPFAIPFDPQTDYPELLDLLRHCGVSRLHVQHLGGHTLDVIRLKHDLGLPLDFSVHDYFAICPQVTLTDAAGRYCGEPDAATCNACLAERPPWPRLDIGAWREKYGAVLSAADRIIAPSRDAAARIARYFPQANIVTAEHPHPANAIPHAGPVTSVLQIAILGVMTRHKGIDRLRAVAAEARRQNLPIGFVLVGYVDQSLAGREPEPGSSLEPFETTGPYIKDTLPDLLQKSGAHLVWFPPQWPETFSYTLSACLEMGLPVVVPDIGAFPDRVAGRAWSWIVPWDWDAPRLLEFFLSIRRNHFLTGIAPVPPPGNPAPPLPRNFYPTEYLERR